MRTLFLIHGEDRPYVPQIKVHSPSSFSGGKVLINEPINYISEIPLLARSHKCDNVITTDYRVLKALFPEKKFKDPDTNGQGATVFDYQGNMIEKDGIPILIQAPLRHLVRSKEAPFLWKHFYGKLLPSRYERFRELGSAFISQPVTAEEFTKCEKFLEECFVISFDIETGADQKITHISFSGITPTAEIRTVAFCIDSIPKWESIKRILSNPVAKIAQNGKYDVVHLLHWNAPVRNFLWDTHALMQCWYSELPRSLDFIASFFILDILYWKDESENDKLLYNAKDAHVTLLSFLQWMKLAPDWAKKNYAQVFKIIFPAISCALEGLKVDPVEWNKMAVEQRLKIDEHKTKLNQLLGKRYFNPNSPPQVKSLLKVLAPKEKIEASDEKTLSRIALRHPLNALLIKHILSYRESLKLFTTYIDSLLWHSRLLYSINPFGTETGRSSSQKSEFNIPPVSGKKYEHYGAQLQNIPPYFKKCLVADEGFLICELDKEQAESRVTAYESQEPALIKAVEESPDFHCTNASAFFGIPFDQLFDVSTKKKLNVPIRDLAKRVNHGANYNMGVYVLIQTMGEHNLWNAKSLLNLPKHFDLKDTAQYLLDKFDEAYPRLRDKVDGWYGELIREWTKTHTLTTADGWTRYFFGDPRESKPALNELVAHKPQHTNVAMVNEGWYKVWLELEDPKTFRLKGQVHDSILFQVHKDHLHLIEKAQKIYDETSVLTVHGKRMFIPSALQGPKESWK